MTTLITGGAGFVGSHLADRCIANGDHVVIADNLSTGKLANLEDALKTGKATFVYLDVSGTPAAIRSALEHAKAGKIARIFHLASPASPEAYGAYPWETLLVNGVGTLSLIELALEWGAQLFYSSTSEVYGDPLVHPQPESYFGNVNPIGPRACYDEGKRFAEAAISVAVARRSLDARIVRIFNCYGPRMDIGDGRLIPSFLAAAKAGQPLPIHGDGSQTRSMTYVDDLIDGLLLVSRWKSPKLQPINLGNDEECSVNQIAAAFAGSLGLPLETESLAERPEDPKRRRPDTTMAESIGWKAKVTLAQGLLKTNAWFTHEAVQFA